MNLKSKEIQNKMKLIMMKKNKDNLKKNKNYKILELKLN
jgi:hypothetical protein